MRKMAALQSGARSPADAAQHDRGTSRTWCGAPRPDRDAVVQIGSAF